MSSWSPLLIYKFQFLLQAKKQKETSVEDVMNTGFHQGFESEATPQSSRVDATLEQSGKQSQLENQKNTVDNVQVIHFFYYK